jgi:peroxidase
VLLDKSPSGSSVEKNAVNNIGLAGFDVIDSIKARILDVSCADIVVFAGRESARILSNGNINYTLVSGRLDGVVSSAAEADATLPEPTFSFQQLKDNFNRTAGFDVEDLVILSGAHSIGVAHSSSFQDRLDDATETPIDHSYQTALRVRVKIDEFKTPDPTEKNNIRDMGPLFWGFSGYNSSGVTLHPPEAGILDNSYYTANLQKMVLFRSDWELNNDPTNFATDRLIEYRDNATDWDLDFSDAMGRLSSLTAPGPKFEIRKNCRRTNSGTNSY